MGSLGSDGAKGTADMCKGDSGNMRKKHNTTHHVSDYLKKDDKGGEKEDGELEKNDD